MLAAAIISTAAAITPRRRFIYAIADRCRRR